MASITSGSWRRIGDNALGMGVKRFEDSDKNGLWRLHITKNNPQHPVIDIDCRPEDLREIKRFCEQALEILAYDGGRDAQDVVASAE
jgi:hypothetical protein